MPGPVTSAYWTRLLGAPHACIGPSDQKACACRPSVVLQARVASDQRSFDRNIARRFLLQHASFFSVQTGRSSPYEMIDIRLVDTPREARSVPSADRKSTRLNSSHVA